MAKPDRREPPDDDGPDALTGAIAENVRRLRVRRGLSLERLAQVSGVSRSMLGQIELGQSTPTIKTLWRIAGALKLPFAAMLRGKAQPRTQVLTLGDSKTLSSQDGTFSSRALSLSDDERRVEFYELRLAAKSAEQAEPHPPGTRESLVVAAGALEVSIDGAQYRLSKGDSIVFTADVPHVYANSGSTPALMYLVMTYAEGVG